MGGHGKALLVRQDVRYPTAKATALALARLLRTAAD